jgi:uncharacterized protein YbjT (DUF2867 family)
LTLKELTIAKQTNMNIKRVVVAGATGSLGNKIVKALLDQGAEVTAMVRASSNRSKLTEMGVRNFVVGDMLDKESLKTALSSTHPFDAIVASAAGYTKRKKGDSPVTDTVGYRNLVDATKEAGISRFVLISILESDKVVNVPHFHNKYLIEKYLSEKHQPFIALRAGMFLDQTPDFILKKITKGILPMFMGGTFGMIYTPDLARYVAMAAVSLPDSELNTSIDVGWSTPVNGAMLASAFKKVLQKSVRAKAVIPSFALKFILPIAAGLSDNMHDINEMIKWVATGAYVSKNPQRQKELFGDLPSVEEAVTRYCKDRKLI